MKTWAAIAAFALGVASVGSLIAAQSPAPPLNSVRAVRALSAAEIAQAPLVRVRGVIAFHEPETGLTYVHDDTAGIAVSAGAPSRLPAELRVGRAVEVEGITAQGSYAPVIATPPGRAAPGVRILGEAAMPPPLTLGIEGLLGGAHDGRWVEMRGVVRSLVAKPFPQPPEGTLADEATDGGATPVVRLSIELGTAAGRFTVIIPWKEGRPPPAELLEARVRVRGVLGSIVNRWRQWVGLLLYVPALGEMSVERPPPADPFLLPLRRIDEIMRFAPESPREDRVRVRGVVTLVQPGYRLFVRGEGGPLEVQTRQALPAVKPGTEVEVVGYPTLGLARVLLQDGRVRIVAQQSPPAPLELSRSEVMARYADGELVCLTGQLFQNALRGALRVLVLEAEGQLLEVKFAGNLPPREDERMGLLRPGSELAVTGIAQVAGAADWGGGVRPYAVNLLVRGPADLTVLRQPPWWTPARLLAAVGALLALVVVGAGWVVLLRRRVAAQTEVIRDQARREANERERRRIAQDIHDDLGSRLTQLALLGARVKAAAGEGTATAGLGERISATARATVQTMDEIVWAVNPGNDTLQSLGDYLCKVASSLLAEADIACLLDVPAVLPVRRLSAEQRHNLVLAVREALHNVVKHSRATEAGLTLRFDGATVAIEVHDNGVGLPPAGSGRGHGHGLGNLQRRMEEIGGTCGIAAAAAGGTRVRLAVALAA